MCDQWAPCSEGNCRSYAPNSLAICSSLTWKAWVFWIQESSSSGQRKRPVRKDDSRCVCMQDSWHQGFADGSSVFLNTYSWVSNIELKAKDCQEHQEIHHRDSNRFWRVLESRHITEFFPCLVFQTLFRVSSLGNYIMSNAQRGTDVTNVIRLIGRWLKFAKSRVTVRSHVGSSAEEVEHPAVGKTWSLTAWSGV